MIDTLLFAVRDTIRASKVYGYAECEIMEDDGSPPPRCGNVFVSVHSGTAQEWSGYNDNNLAEVYGFSVTLTMRMGRVSIDKVGEQLIARDIKRVPDANREGFNARAEQLRNMLHMNWGMVVLQGQTPNSANDNIVAWAPGSTAYGFCEPGRWRGIQGRIQLVGGEWFGADPDAESFGIKAEFRIDGVKRFQPVAAASGPFV